KDVRRMYSSENSRGSAQEHCQHRRRSVRDRRRSEWRRMCSRCTTPWHKHAPPPDASTQHQPAGSLHLPRRERHGLAQMTGIDWLILLLYFMFVLGIGVALKGRTKTSTDFFLAGRAIPAWVCGLAFLSANLGAQEVIGMGASGAKYGIATSHFYWIGAIPAMVFVGI